MRSKGAKMKLSFPTKAVILGMALGAFELNFMTGVMPAGLTFARAGAGTYVGANGLIQSAAAGVPRFEYDPLTLAMKGLLLEESRTNGLTYSQDYANAAWTKARVALTAGATAAPDGTMTGTRIQETGEASTKVVQQNQTFAAGSQTVTVYAKAGERNWLYLGISNGGTFSAHYNLTDGTIGTTAGTVTATTTHVGNGWYRCRLTWTAVAGSGTVFIRIASNSSTTTYTGDNASGLYLWGSQNEVGLFATSYIPTTATAITRPADTLDSAEPHFSSWFNRAQGTLAMELSSFGAGKTNGVMFIQRTGAGPRHQITYGTTGVVGAAVVNDSDVVDVGGIGAAGTVVPGAVTKLAYAYANNDFVFTRDNLAVVTDLSGSVPLTVNVARFGFANGTPLNGHLRRFRYWNTRQTNTQVRELTV